MATMAVVCTSRRASAAVRAARRVALAMRVAMAMTMMMMMVVVAMAAAGLVMRTRACRWVRVCVYLCCCWAPKRVLL